MAKNEGAHHGTRNADGSQRDHCCGCWNIYVGVTPDEPTIFAKCNECGEIRDLSAPLQEALA